MSMDKHEERVKDFIRVNGIQAEHRHFEQSCHTVEEAAQAVGADPGMLVKNVCMVDSSGEMIVAIVKGDDRVSASRVQKALSLEERPSIASPEQILGKSGYPVGGVPSFGYEAVFLVDPRVTEMKEVWTGGGSDHSLIRVSPEEILRANSARVARVRK